MVSMRCTLCLHPLEELGDNVVATQQVNVVLRAGYNKLKIASHMGSRVVKKNRSPRVVSM